MSGPLDGGALRDAVAAAGLDPGALEEVTEPSDKGMVWVLHTSGDWFDAWQRLRDAVPVTGRWPLAVTNLATGWNQEPSTGRRDLRPGAVMARLPSVDVEALLDACEGDGLREPLEEWVDWHLEETEDLCGTAPSLEQLRAALGEEPVEMAVERWLLDWELAHCPEAELGREAGYLDWFRPGPEVMVALLPRPEPWAAAVYVGHYGCWDPDNDLRPALVRQWCLEYGAEPAANWGTMQQLVVRRPPTDLDRAWQLARAQGLLWPDTCVLPGVPVRHWARDLLGRDRWFLHLRP